MTYDAWVVDKRPIFSRLPDSAYKQNPVVDFVTYFADQLLIDTKASLDRLPIQLNPLTCDRIWLDYLSLLYGWVDLWDITWNDSIKRTLLDNSFQKVSIWGNKGSFTILEFLLQTFSVRHIIQLGASFLVDFSKVGDQIGSVSWQFDIILPGEYYNTNTTKLVQWIKIHFTPCWCSSSIIYDDTKFRDQVVLIFEDGSYFSIGIDTALSI